MSGFDSVADFYEALADSEARRERERPFLDKSLRLAPGNRTLDMACGNGFHAVILAELGARVIAADISPQMVGIAERTRPHPAVSYVVNDMRYPLNGPYDIAFCLGNSLSLLDSLEDVGLMMKNMADVLSPGGLLVVQTLNYELPAAHEPRHRVERKTVDGREVVAVKSLIPHRDRTLLSLAFFAEGDERYQSTADTGVLLHVSEEQIAAAAQGAGMRVMGVYGGFDEKPFAADTSSDLVMMIRR